MSSRSYDDDTDKKPSQQTSESRLGRQKLAKVGQISNHQQQIWSNERRESEYRVVKATV
jgi:hypothetical protein